jgi:hypothetical protein
MRRDKMLFEAQFEMRLFVVETEAQKYIQDFLSTICMRFKDMMAENELIHLDNIQNCWFESRND